MQTFRITYAGLNKACFFTNTYIRTELSISCSKRVIDIDLAIVIQYVINLFVQIKSFFTHQRQDKYRCFFCCLHSYEHQALLRRDFLGRIFYLEQVSSQLFLSMFIFLKLFCYFNIMFTKLEWGSVDVFSFLVSYWGNVHLVDFTGLQESGNWLQ